MLTPQLHSFSTFVRSMLLCRPSLVTWSEIWTKHRVFSAKMLIWRRGESVEDLVNAGCLKRILEIKWHPDSPIAIKVWISARDNMDLRRNCVIFVILTIYSAGWKYCCVILQWAGQPVDFFNLSRKTWLKNSSFQRYQLYYREHVAV